MENTDRDQTPRPSSSSAIPITSSRYPESGRKAMKSYDPTSLLAIPVGDSEEEDLDMGSERPWAPHHSKLFICSFTAILSPDTFCVSSSGIA